jgi:quinohemoprotein ethanol dehydrogenase
VKRLLWVGIIGLSVAFGADVSPAAVKTLAASGAAAVNWPGHGGGADETAYSKLDQIDTGSVGRLGPAWFLDLPDERTLAATPLAIDGVLYFTGSYAAVYAVDGVSGRLLWKYDPEVWKHTPQKLRFALPVNRGVAYANGRIFVGTLDGRLIALNAKTGNLLWSVETATAQSFQTITGAPRVFNAKVIIGNGGADFSARGYVTAYDQATGKQAWRFYVTPGTPDENRGDAAMERAAATWSSDFLKKGGGGGGPWDSITFDEQLNRVYVGTGNASPYDPEERSPGGGDNLYTASIVCLDAETGKYVWHYQVNPRDSWDFDSTQQMALANLAIDGMPRKVLMQASKNGFLYVIDRTTGKLLSAGKIGKATWADHIDLKTGRPVEVKNVHYQEGPITVWPAPTGAHNWHSMSFSPRTGLLYIPYMQLGMSYAKQNGEGDSLVGLTMSMVKEDPQDGKGALLAYDPLRQKVRWMVQHPTYWNGGTMSTAGGLVFQGTADGFFSAYDALTGARLWQFNAGLGIVAAPISYSVHGVQYVSVLVGYGSSNSIGDVMSAGWKYGAQPRRLLTFQLDGKIVLPASAPPDFAVHPADDPGVKIDAADVAPGRMLFTMNCAACHGLNVVSAGAPAPDLRESPAAMEHAALWSIVHDGALLQRGMPRFDKLDAAEVRQIHAYIRAQARLALGVEAGR